MDIVTNKSLSLNLVVADGISLPRVSRLKILGVTFSSNLRWDEHFETFCVKP